VNTLSKSVSVNLYRTSFVLSRSTASLQPFSDTEIVSISGLRPYSAASFNMASISGREPMCDAPMLEPFALSKNISLYSK
jgi:hypothetical protein